MGLATAAGLVARWYLSGVICCSAPDLAGTPTHIEEGNNPSPLGSFFVLEKVDAFPDAFPIAIAQPGLRALKVVPVRNCPFLQKAASDCSWLLQKACLSPYCLMA